MGLKLSEQVKGYVSEDEARWVKAHAEELGMSVSTLIRVLVIRELRQYKDAAPVEPVTTAEMCERL